MIAEVLLKWPLVLAAKTDGADAAHSICPYCAVGWAVSTILGSLITRFAWVGVGKVSARDPRPALDLDRSNAARLRQPVGQRAPARKPGQQKSEPAGQK